MFQKLYSNIFGYGLWCAYLISSQYFEAIIIEM